MNERNEIHVNIGEVKIGKADDILKATLGSCVGIAFLWKEKNLYGLAHCLLPVSADVTFSIGAKYVNQAIPSLVALMKLEAKNFKKIEVVLAGGSNMMAQLSCKNKNNVGKQNMEAARINLEKLGFYIKREDLGGEVGRQIFIDCKTSDVQIIKLPVLQKETNWKK